MGEITRFDHKYMSDMEGYAVIDREIKNLTEKRNVFRDNLLEAMENTTLSRLIMTSSKSLG